MENTNSPFRWELSTKGNWTCVYNDHRLTTYRYLEDRRRYTFVCAGHWNHPAISYETELEAREAAQIFYRDNLGVLTYESARAWLEKIRKEGTFKKYVPTSYFKKDKLPKPTDGDALVRAGMVLATKVVDNVGTYFKTVEQVGVHYERN